MCDSSGCALIISEYQKTARWTTSTRIRLANHHVASKHMVRVLLLRDCDPLAQVLHKGLDFRSGHQLRKQAS